MLKYWKSKSHPFTQTQSLFVFFLSMLNLFLSVSIMQIIPLHATRVVMLSTPVRLAVFFLPFYHLYYAMVEAVTAVHELHKIVL